MRGSFFLFRVRLKLRELFPVFPDREGKGQKAANPYDDEQQYKVGAILAGSL